MHRIYRDYMSPNVSEMDDFSPYSGYPKRATGEKTAISTPY